MAGRGSWRRSNALILGAYGRALLAAGETETPCNTSRNRAPATAATPRAARSGAGHAKLAIAAMASLVTAERYAVSGRLADAGIHAKRAVDLLPRGSTGWRRAQDVLAASKERRKETDPMNSTNLALAIAGVAGLGLVVAVAGDVTRSTPEAPAPAADGRRG